MDLFDKCAGFYGRAEYARELGHPANPRMLEALGLYPYFIPIDTTGGTEVVIEGRPRIMMGSNNYLGMTVDPRVQEAAAAAIEEYGTGCTGSRFMNGTLELHLALEARLAHWVGMEAALVFASGYQANLGIVAGLLRDGDVVIADREVHASLIDGIRLAHGEHDVEARYFRHNDTRSLERILASQPLDRPKLVAVDGVFSASGDVAPLPAIAALCREYAARLLVDDAHGIGVLGGGRGTPTELDCADHVDLVMGTFSKSLASGGGFVAGPRDVIHWLQHYGRSFMFSASLPPANAATVMAVLDVLEEEPERVVRVNAIAKRLRRALRELGYDVGGGSHGAIVPVVIGDQFRTVQAWRRFMDDGIYTNAVLPPAVPRRRSALRTSCMATHTDGQIDYVIEAFRGLKTELGAMRVGIDRGKRTRSVAL
jgi:8-amino-7-oxononanoate synthase